MAWSIVGSKGTATNTNVSPQTVNCGQSSTAGNLLICMVQSGAAAAPSFPGGWTNVVSITSTSANEAWIFANFNNPGGISSISVSFTTGGSLRCQIIEYTCPGVSGVLAADKTGTVTNASPVSPLNIATSGNLTANNELAVAIGTYHDTGASSSVVGAGAGFTQDNALSSGTSGPYHVGWDHELDTGSSSGGTVTDAMTFSLHAAGTQQGAIATFAQGTSLPPPLVISQAVKRAAFF